MFSPEAKDGIEIIKLLSSIATPVAVTPDAHPAEARVGG